MGANFLEVVYWQLNYGSSLIAASSGQASLDPLREGRQEREGSFTTTNASVYLCECVHQKVCEEYSLGFPHLFFHYFVTCHRIVVEWNCSVERGANKSGKKDDVEREVGWPFQIHWTFTTFFQL